MGNIVYKVAPREKVDHIIWDLKKIILKQHAELEVLKNHTIVYGKNEPKLFEALSDEYGYLEFLDIGDVVEVIFNFNKEDSPYENGIPFIGVITEINRGWYTSEAVSYEILVMNRSTICYGEPRLKERITFDQDEVRDGIAKVSVILSAKPINDKYVKVDYEQVNYIKEVI